MAYIFIHGHRIKVSGIDALIDFFLFLWPGDNGQVRKTPRNVYDYQMFFIGFVIAALFLPIAWLLSHLPLIWPEALACMAAVICVTIGQSPYKDYFRALVVLIAASLLLHYHVTFDATIWGFHIEKYLYYIAIAVALFTLWRRFFNWLCWTQIDRLSKKYGIPHYDQKTLMDNYEGYDTHYGETKMVYLSYQEAMNAEKVLQEQDSSYVKR